MKHFTIIIILALFAVLNCFRSSGNIYASGVKYSSCVIRLNNALPADSGLLTANGFDCICDASGENLSAYLLCPDSDDIALAYRLQARFAARGSFSIIELTGTGSALLPSGIRTKNIYSDGNMTCREFEYHGKSYQLAVRGNNVIIGSPVIGSGY